MKPNRTNQTIEQQRALLIKKRQSLVTQFSKAANDGKQRRLAAISSRIEQTNEFLTALHEIEADAQKNESPGVPRFAVSSLFLHESFRKLTTDQDEQFFFITGTEIEGIFVLDQWAEFAHQKRTIMGVTADQRSTHRLLIKLEQFGHRLLAHFHSHPGNGAGSTYPSGTDKDFQTRLESAGHLAVMAIFSRDGFVRFMRLDKTFEIEIYGQGVERHAENVFQLTNLDQN